MLNAELLQKKIANSGMSITFISKKVGIARETLYNKINGKSDFSATEIVALTELLRLTRAERDKIFLDGKLN